MARKSGDEAKVSGAGTPGFTLPSTEGIFEAMELARKTWAGLGASSGVVMPGLDPDEIERRLTDLRAVEQWLGMNLNLLRGTIQTLEIQHGAILALRALGQSAPIDSAGAKVGNPGVARTGAPIDPTVMWQQLQEQFQRIALAALASGTAPATGKQGEKPVTPKRPARKPGA